MNEFGKNLFENFTPRETDIFGWNGLKPFITNIVRKIKPETIIEVGTWKGLSALTLANAQAEYSSTGKIYCVDTWQGSADFWYNECDDFNLNLVNGYPSVYYTFLSNVYNAGMGNRIVPVPLPSNVAYKVFKERIKLTADLIYIDGSHEEEDVFKDLSTYINLLNDGGVIFGDDYPYPSVKKAVEDYTKQNNIQFFVEEENNFWFINKNR
jgi:predicted O-methyltransferase YrrM